MGKQRKTVLVGLALAMLALAGAVAWLWPGIAARLANTGDEPTFQGKPSSQWRRELRAELAAPQKEAQPVSHALLHGKADAVPVLIQLLDDDDVQVRRVSGYFLSLHFTSKPGPEAAAAVGPLTARLRDDDTMVRRWAVEALGYLGPQARAALPEIAKLLKDPDEWIAWDASWALGNMGPEARTALPALRQARNDPRPLVQKGAASALQKIEPTEKE
jgi:HEAT repeat protein